MGDAPTPLQKLAGLQGIIPQFDAVSAVTPTFFIDNFESITTAVECTDEEKLLILKSRIRGQALSHLINCPDLSNETDYDTFKTKFLDFFDKKVSLATRQQQFASCKMKPGESTKIYAARVGLITQRFFNNPDLTVEAVKTLFEQSKLSKFLDGLRPEFKHATLMKNPENFQDAVDFVELLETNQSCIDSNTSLDFPTINATTSQVSNEDIKLMLETHAKQTHESICSLTKEIEQLKITNSNSSTNSNSQPNYRNYPNNRNNITKKRFFDPCEYCGKTNHTSSFCFYKNRNHQQHRTTRSSSSTNYNNREFVPRPQMNRYRSGCSDNTPPSDRLNYQRGIGHK